MNTRLINLTKITNHYRGRAGGVMWTVRKHGARRGYWEATPEDTSAGMAPFVRRGLKAVDDELSKLIKANRDGDADAWARRPFNVSRYTGNEFVAWRFGWNAAERRKVQASKMA